MLLHPHGPRYFAKSHHGEGRPETETLTVSSRATPRNKSTGKTSPLNPNDANQYSAAHTDGAGQAKDVLRTDGATIHLIAAAADTRRAASSRCEVKISRSLRAALPEPEVVTMPEYAVHAESRRTGECPPDCGGCRADGCGARTC